MPNYRDVIPIKTYLTVKVKLNGQEVETDKFFISTIETGKEGTTTIIVEVNP